MQHVSMRFICQPECKLPRLSIFGNWTKEEARDEFKLLIFNRCYNERSLYCRQMLIECSLISWPVCWAGKTLMPALQGQTGVISSYKVIQHCRWDKENIQGRPLQSAGENQVQGLTTAMSRFMNNIFVFSRQILAHHRYASIRRYVLRYLLISKLFFKAGKNTKTTDLNWYK